MAEWAAKRFWKDTSVAEGEGGFEVHLDGRPVRTPAKAALVVPTRKLAEMIQTEWEAQVETIDPNTMPTTRGANAAIDKVAVQHGEVADMLADYGDSDLLCYRADYPAELLARQQELWDPILEWAADHMSARLAPRQGIMHQPQDPKSLARLKEATHQFTNFELAAFHDLVSMSGSLILGFAVTEGHLSPETAWDLSRVDENFQIEQWGEDEEEAKTVRIKQESFLQAARFYQAIK